MIPWLAPILDRLRTLTDTSASWGRLPAQDDLGAVVGPELPVETLRAGLDAIGFELLDWRQEPRAGRGEAHGTRDISRCTALLWHQTAAMLSLEQALGVPAHAIIYERTVILLHPIRAYVYHSGAGNAFNVGIEVVSRAAGLEGDLRTLWRSKREKNGYRDKRGIWHPPVPAADLVREATDGQLAAGRLLGAYYVAEVERQGGAIVASMYHRNTSSSRVSDPGSRIAWNVGLRVAEAHALQHGGPVVGSGKRTPTCWGGELGVTYNWRVRGY